MIQRTLVLAQLLGMTHYGDIIAGRGPNKEVPQLLSYLISSQSTLANSILELGTNKKRMIFSVLINTCMK
jgi:hypothetical protein